MTSLFTVRRRAEEFAEAVDGAVRSAGAHEAELADFVAIVARLRDHEQDIAPRREFAGDLRSRLMAEAQVALSPQNARLVLPVRKRGARERRLVAAATAVVLIGGTTSMAAAAQNSLPGEALYPIKRAVERAEAGISMSDVGKGQDLLGHAEARLAEVEGLVVGDSRQGDPRVSGTLSDFAVQADEGSALLLKSFEQTQNRDSVLAVRVFATESIAALERIAESVPADAQDELAAAALTLRDIDEHATSLCGTCLSEAPAVEVPDSFVARAEVNRALEAATIDILDNSHPVVVPRRVVETNTPTRAPRENPSPGGSQPTDAASGATQAPPTVPPGPALPDTLPTPSAPDSDEQVAERGPDAVSVPPQATKHDTSVTSDPGSAVETLLPEPEAAPLQ